jgi:hypothetical protein
MDQNTLSDLIMPKTSYAALAAFIVTGVLAPPAAQLPDLSSAPSE